jgi:hypothetical protein
MRSIFNAREVKENQLKRLESPTIWIYIQVDFGRITREEYQSSKGYNTFVNPSSKEGSVWHYKFLQGLLGAL